MKEMKEQKTSSSAGPKKRIQDRALLVELRISTWTPSKKDEAATSKALEAMGAKEGAGVFKKLIAAKEYLADINKVRGQAFNNVYYKYTKSWIHRGPNIVSARLYPTLAKEIDECKREFNAAKDKLKTLLPQIKEDAKQRLGAMYNIEDFPSAGDLDTLYRFEFTARKIEDSDLSDDLRADIGESEAEKIRAESEALIKQRVSEATHRVFEEVYRVVRKMREKLADEDAIFRDSLIENVAGLVDRLPELNFSDDPELEKLAHEMKEKLTGFDPDEMRKSARKRKQAARAAAAVEKKAESAMQDSSRKLTQVADVFAA